MNSPIRGKVATDERNRLQTKKNRVHIGYTVHFSKQKNQESACINLIFHGFFPENPQPQRGP